MRKRVVLAALVAGALMERRGSVPAAAAPAMTDWNWLIVADGPAAADEREAVVRALRLLSALPARVAILDAERARPGVKETLLRLDAFVVKGRTGGLHRAPEPAAAMAPSGVSRCAPTPWPRWCGTRWPTSTAPMNAKPGSAKKASGPRSSATSRSTRSRRSATWMPWSTDMTTTCWRPVSRQRRARAVFTAFAGASCRW